MELMHEIGTMLEMGDYGDARDDSDGTASDDAEVNSLCNDEDLDDDLEEVEREHDPRNQQSNIPPAAESETTPTELTPIDRLAEKLFKLCVEFLKQNFDS